LTLKWGVFFSPTFGTSEDRKEVAEAVKKKATAARCIGGEMMLAEKKW